MKNTFALNHRVAPKMALTAFFDLAASLGVSEVEIRNDLGGVASLECTTAADIRSEADRRGLFIISINALQRFNDWTDTRAIEARAMIGFAKASGARAIVLCPVNDFAFQPDDATRLRGVRTALEALAPMLREAGLIGLVEPLGFAECSLRSKREAVAAIDAVDGGDVLRVVHDTFHHHVAGEPEFFPHRTGLVHISGVDDPEVPVAAMRDPHRVLVTPSDRIDNIGQMRTLAAGGYDGPFSFEPFADSVSDHADIRTPLEAGIRSLRDAMETQRS